MPLRLIDKKRCDYLQTMIEANPQNNEVWYIHSVLAQCFLPYRNPKNAIHWIKENGKVAMVVTADAVKNQHGEFVTLGLPFGAKPRLFLSKIQTEAVRRQSPVIPVKTSMTGMLKELGFQVTGGKKGTIASFKEQTSRLAACRFRVIHSQTGEGGQLVQHENTDIFQQFELWFPTHPDQQTLWPTEITLTNAFYENLKAHAIPYDFRGLKHIQNTRGKLISISSTIHTY